MSGSTQLDAVLELALQLAPGDRLRLVEQVVASVGQELKQREGTNQPAEDEPWGKRLVRLVRDLDPTDLVDSDIEDPIEWIQAQRRKDASRLDTYWRGDA
jgi:hypothetical protein